MRADARADGSLILLGASMMILTVLVPRFKDYALCGFAHAAAGLVAVNLGPSDGRALGRSTNFAAVWIASVLVAYQSERRRRENLLLAWRLRNARQMASRAGAPRWCRSGARWPCHCDTPFRVRARARAYRERCG